MLFCTNRRLPESIIPVTNYMSTVSALYKTPGQASHNHLLELFWNDILVFITSTPHVINVTLISVKFTKQNTLNDRKYTYTKYHIISYHIISYHTGSIAIKHCRNWVEASITRYSNFHKYTRSFTESYKSLKTNLILQNKIVSVCQNAMHIG